MAPAEERMVSRGTAPGSVSSPEEQWTGDEWLVLPISDI